MLIKRDKKGGSALDRLRRQKGIQKRIDDGTVKIAGKQEALVIALDASASMTGTSDPRDPYGRPKWSAACKATADLVSLSRASSIGVVVFDHTVLGELPVGTASDEIRHYLSAMGPKHGTCFVTGLEAGRRLIESGPTKTVRRIILLSDGYDGAHRGGSALDVELIYLAEASVIVDTVGFGDADEVKLRMIAERTGGVYKHANDAAELVREFKQLEAGVRGLLGGG